MKKNLFALGLIITSVVSIAIVQQVHAVGASDWQAGNIIDDSVFYDKSSMTVGQIQQFLDSKVSCDPWGEKGSELGGGTRAQWASAHGYALPFICLSGYYENTATLQNNLDGRSIPSGAKSAAQIIWDTAQSYNINPQVLIVLLQKEQGLVTDEWPVNVQYRSAAGYGCPDSALCDSKYYGFYNQIESAAWQFRRYVDNPAGFNHWAGGVNSVRWSPNSACGASDVYIENQATASLYNYTPYQPNQAALNNMYGLGDDCSAYGNRNFWRYFNDWFGSTHNKETIISYKSHVSYVGWTDATTNSGVTGTVGRGAPIEAFKINGGVEYSSYNYETGWQPTVNGGMISGTTGLNRPIHAVKINPTGSLAAKYDVYYRVHASYVGWMGWAKNGSPAGVAGNSDNKIEAVEVKLVLKGMPFNGSTDNAFQDINSIVYAPPLSLSVTSHIGGVGWQPSVTDSMVSGTTEQDRRMEAVKISLNNTTGIDGGITYSAHVADIGWQDYVPDGSVAGTTGQFRRMEAVRIALTGSLGDNYDVVYRGYVRFIGWMPWTKNGYPAGSVGASLQLEAIEARIVPKNTIVINQQNGVYNPYGLPTPASYGLDYSAHVSYVGWINGIKQNNIGGTTGRSLSIEALQFNELKTAYGDVAISCSAYVKTSGWTADAAIGNICGTTGQTKPLQAVKLTLSGDASSKYNLYYRSHISYLGWQDWVKDGAISGAPDSGSSVEAVQIKLIEK